MKKNHELKYVLLAAALLMGMGVKADDIEVRKFAYAGPYEVKMPVMMDSVDVNKKAFDAKGLLDTAIDMDATGSVFEGVYAPTSNASMALHTLSFSMTNNRFTKAKVSVSGLKDYKVYVDGKPNGGEQSFVPAQHRVVIKYMTRAGESLDTLKVNVGVKEAGAWNISVNDGSSLRPYTIYDVMLGERYTDISLSPDGKYIIYCKTNTSTGGRTSRKYFVKELSTGRIVDETTNSISWMPRTNKYMFTRMSKGTGADVNGKNELVTVVPSTRKEIVIARGVPNSHFTMSPTEDYLVVSTYQDGPREDSEVYEVIEPEDRQAGWRNRTGLAKFDLKSGMLQPLTYGYHNVYLSDISQDGKYVLMMKSENRLTSRPTTLFSIYRMAIDDLSIETIVEKDGFIGGASFTADGKGILLQGNPECLGGIGKNVKEGQTPSMIDNQLYLYDITTKNITPLTKDFNPNVGNVKLSASDGMFYFTAEDKDCVHLFQLNPRTKTIKMIKEPEDVVSKFTVSSGTGAIAYYGQGASNSDRMYSLNVKTQKSTLIDDLSAERLDGISIGECKPWTYVNAQGDSICCRYYLPADFDASKKYPMIVNYYGGCSPTERTFESRYPHNAYSALGYIVLVVNPHGATGFGQEWSAAHVNTAGKGPAEDIIESTKAFCKEHSWVNDKKIGCIGASYGGFMTQYLQTVTDIFAAAISHAGISDHTSYWGFGYWGYSYSEVSMANSYPWTRKDLFVDQSPLYNADKIHTPLLFVHGDADTNVPVNESIQMYTALKLLGRETAMVLVKDQNHHITEYDKRIKWQNTIWAWFAKWLQDDPSWWESMYPEKAL